MPGRLEINHATTATALNIFYVIYLHVKDVVYNLFISSASSYFNF